MAEGLCFNGFFSLDLHDVAFSDGYLIRSMSNWCGCQFMVDNFFFSFFGKRINMCGKERELLV